MARAKNGRTDPLKEVLAATQALLASQRNAEFELGKMQLNQQELLKGHKHSHELLAELQSGVAALDPNGSLASKVQRRGLGLEMVPHSSLVSFTPGSADSRPLAFFANDKSDKNDRDEERTSVAAAKLSLVDHLEPLKNDSAPLSEFEPGSGARRPSRDSRRSRDSNRGAALLSYSTVDLMSNGEHGQAPEGGETPRPIATRRGPTKSVLKNDQSMGIDAVEFSTKPDSSLGNMQSVQSNASRLPTRRSSNDSNENSFSSQTKKTRGKLLPTNWPECLTLRDELEEIAEDDADEGVHSTMFRGSARVSGWSGSGKWQGGQAKQPLLKYFASVFSFGVALNPDSRLIITKEMLGFGVLLYDLLITPYIVAWEIEVNGFLMLLSWLAGLYWSLDCFLSFLTGYNKHGELITRQPDSLRHYVKRSFALDAALLIVDWINILQTLLTQGSEGSGENILRVGKMSRILKVLRLARLVQLVEKMSMYNLSQSTIHHLNLLLNMLKVTFFLLLFNHIMCCFWYMAGVARATDTRETWLDLPSDQEGLLFSEVEPMYQYLTALHWNIAQMTLGSSDVVPRNSVERIFNISLLVAGLLIGSTVVSLFSAQIVQFIIDKHDEAMLLDTLQRFLAQNSVGPNLRVRVMSQVDERLREQGHLAEEDVPALQMLSATLRMELMFEIRMPHLSTHPVFQMWCDMDIDALRRLCDSAVSFCFLSSSDDLFLTGQPSNEAFFLVRGSLYYTQQPSAAMVDDFVARSITESTWFCEAALWANWIHVGDMRAKKVSNLVEVSATGLLAVLNHHEAVRSMTMQYGKNFHVRIVSAVPPHASYPDDVQVPFTAASDLLSHHVGLALLKRADRQKTINLTPEARKNLEKELKTEKCAVQRRKGGHGLERIVAVAAVRVMSSEGRFYYQIAKWEEGKALKFSCQLPGTKRARGELPQAALDRIMREDLRHFIGLLQWTKTEHELETTISEQFMMPSTYMRTIHQATLHGPERLETLPKCGNNKSQEELEAYPYPVNHIACREVFVYCAPNKTSKAVLCCWLHPVEVEALKSPPAEVTGAMKQWLESLGVKEAIHASALNPPDGSESVAGADGANGQAEGVSPQPTDQAAHVVYDDDPADAIASPGKALRASKVRGSCQYEDEGLFVSPQYGSQRSRNSTKPPFSYEIDL